MSWDQDAPIACAPADVQRAMAGPYAHTAQTNTSAILAPRSVHPGCVILKFSFPSLQLDITDDYCSC